MGPCVRWVGGGASERHSKSNGSRIRAAFEFEWHPNWSEAVELNGAANRPRKALEREGLWIRVQGHGFARQMSSALSLNISSVSMVAVTITWPSKMPPPHTKITQTFAGAY